VSWNAATQNGPSFNRVQQMARTISQLQAEVALWRQSSQVTCFCFAPPKPLAEAPVMETSQAQGHLKWHGGVMTCDTNTCI
jgi:hypothetical protein